MSTEAMRKSFEQWAGPEGYNLDWIDNPGCYDSTATHCSFGAWQAATANQEALIKAALDAAAEKCDAFAKTACKAEEFTEGSNFERAAEAIRQITPQQVMERMK